jgi:hypothetical protein
MSLPIVSKYGITVEQRDAKIKEFEKYVKSLNVIIKLFIGHLIVITEILIFVKVLSKSVLNAFPESISQSS